MASSQPITTNTKHKSVSTTHNPHGATVQDFEDRAYHDWDLLTPPTPVMSQVITVREFDDANTLNSRSTQMTRSSKYIPNDEPVQSVDSSEVVQSDWDLESKDWNRREAELRGVIKAATGTATGKEAIELGHTFTGTHRNLPTRVRGARDQRYRDRTSRQNPEHRHRYTPENTGIGASMGTSTEHGGHEGWLATARIVPYRGNKQQHPNERKYETSSDPGNSPGSPTRRKAEDTNCPRNSNERPHTDKSRYSGFKAKKSKRAHLVAGRREKRRFQQRDVYRSDTASSSSSSASTPVFTPVRRFKRRQHGRQHSCPNHMCVPPYTTDVYKDNRQVKIPHWGCGCHVHAGCMPTGSTNTCPHMPTGSTNTCTHMPTGSTNTCTHMPTGSLPAGVGYLDPNYGIDASLSGALRRLTGGGSPTLIMNSNVVWPGQDTTGNIQRKQVTTTVGDMNAAKAGVCASSHSSSSVDTNKQASPNVAVCTSGSDVCTGSGAVCAGGIVSMSDMHRKDAAAVVHKSKTQNCVSNTTSHLWKPSSATEEDSVAKAYTPRTSAPTTGSRLSPLPLRLPPPPRLHRDPVTTGASRYVGGMSTKSVTPVIKRTDSGSRRKASINLHLSDKGRLKKYQQREEWLGRVPLPVHRWPLQQDVPAVYKVHDPSSTYKDDGAVLKRTGNKNNIKNSNYEHNTSKATAYVDTSSPSSPEDSSNDNTDSSTYKYVSGCTVYKNESNSCDPKQDVSKPSMDSHDRRPTTPKHSTGSTLLGSFTSRYGLGNVKTGIDLGLRRNTVSGVGLEIGLVSPDKLYEDIEHLRSVALFDSPSSHKVKSFRRLEKNADTRLITFAGTPQIDGPVPQESAFLGNDRHADMSATTQVQTEEHPQRPPSSAGYMDRAQELHRVLQRISENDPLSGETAGVLHGTGTNILGRRHSDRILREPPSVSDGISRRRSVSNVLPTRGVTGTNENTGGHNLSANNDNSYENEERAHRTLDNVLQPKAKLE